MRVFHVKAYEGSVSTGQAVYSSPSLSELFGSVDRLHVGGYASDISGSSPTLQIQEQFSLDGENWVPGNILTGGTPISLLGPETKFQGADFDQDLSIFGLKAAFRRLFISVAGAGATAMVHVWATGRDRSRRARALAFTG
jgi:hypothetical protein